MKYDVSNVRARMQRITASFDAQIAYIESVTPRVYFGDVFDTVPASEYWVATGWGRIRHIADKVSASLASTGTPSFFVDAANESHGLKLLGRSSRVLLFHRRGRSANSLKQVLEAIPMSVPVDVVTDQPEGWVPRTGNLIPVVAPDPVALHAEPDILALAIGDSFVAGLESARGFSELDFLKDHPKGSLGKNIAGAQIRTEVAYLPPPLQALGALKEERDGLHVLVTGLDDMATHGWLDIFARPYQRIITTGMGKPGYCMRYLAYMLNELGRSAFYLHPAEGVHGDLGRIGKDSLVISYSHSGETEEILNILPRVKERGATLLALTNNPGSAMGKAADAVLKAGAPEVDPIRKAPTGSTTAALSLAASLVCADSPVSHRPILRVGA